MNVFKKNLMDSVKDKKTYEASELQVIIHRERTLINRKKRDGVIGIYAKKEHNEGYSLDAHEAVIRATNVMDENDFIDYRLIALPAGRAAFGGYLYPKNLDRSKISSYSFLEFWYSIFGERISLDRRFTVDELKGFLRIFKSKMEQTKYQCLYELKYKDSFEGKREFEGSKYFVGILDGNIRIFENIKGDETIKLQELGTFLKKGDFSKLNNAILNSLPSKMKKQILAEATVANIGVRIGKKKFEIVAKSYNSGGLDNNTDSPFELINLCTVTNSSRLYDEPYFTKDAFCKIVEEIEKKRGKSK